MGRCIWRGQSCEAGLDELAVQEDVGESDLPAEKFQGKEYYGDEPYQKETLTADAFFDFGSSNLSTQGRAALDFLLRQLRGMTLEGIV